MSANMKNNIMKARITSRESKKQAEAMKEQKRDRDCKKAIREQMKKINVK